MNAINNKLNSKKGASVLLAMLLLVLCASVSAVMLSAASANLAKIKEEKNSLQSSQTLKSAFNILTEGIGSFSYERKEFIDSSATAECGYFADHMSAVASEHRSLPQSALISDETAKGFLWDNTLFKSAIALRLDQTAEGKTTDAYTFNIEYPGLDNIRVSAQIEQDFSLVLTIMQYDSASSPAGFKTKMKVIYVPDYTPAWEISAELEANNTETKIVSQTITDPKGNQITQKVPVEYECKGSYMVRDLNISWSRCTVLEAQQ